MATSTDATCTSVFIEAPGKLAWFRKELPKYFSDPVVFATYGRLFDLGPLPMPGQLSIEILDQWLPVIGRPVKEMSNLASKSSVVILATDNDAEGDLIASHIASFVDESSEVYRLRLNELTKQGLAYAISNLEKYNPHDRGSLLRRCFDYTIGAEFSDTAQKLPASRVIIPALQQSKSFDVIDSVLRGHESGYWFDYTCSSGELSPRELSDKGFLNTYKLLLDGAIDLPLSAEEIEAAAQGLYENGYTTYTRTDSQVASDETIAGVIGSIWNSSHLQIDLAASASSVASAHQAIMPLKGIDGHVEISDSNQSMLYRYIVTRTLDVLYSRSYEVGREFAKMQFRGNGVSAPAASTEILGVKMFLRSAEGGLSVPCIPGYAIPSTYDYLVKGFNNPLRGKSVPNLLNAIRLLELNELTTPGQVVRHAKRLASFLNDEFSLNYRGRETLRLGLEKLPDLQDLNIVRKLNRYLNTPPVDPLEGLEQGLGIISQKLPRNMMLDASNDRWHQIQTPITNTAKPTNGRLDVDTPIVTNSPEQEANDLAYHPISSRGR